MTRRWRRIVLGGTGAVGILAASEWLTWRASRYGLASDQLDPGPDVVGELADRLQRAGDYQAGELILVKPLLIAYEWARTLIRVRRG